MSRDERPRPGAAADGPLAAVDLGASYAGRQVLHGVTLSATHGQITVLVGPSGAGKSTCIRHMVGLAMPSEGRTFINGRDTFTLSDDELRDEQQNMSVMLQGSTLYGGGLSWSLSVFENVALPLRVRTRLSDAAVRVRVVQKLEYFGLEDRADVPLSDLSAGMVQRVSLARALVSDSAIVVLDSPETGVDGVRMNAVIDGIRAAHRDTGATFLIATHHVDLARALADKLAVIRAGRIVADGPLDEVMRDPSGFASRFARGEPVEGLAMTDQLEGPIEPLPDLVEPSDRRVWFHVAFAIAALLAIIVLLLAGLVVFRGPNVPPGQ